MPPEWPSCGTPQTRVLHFKRERWKLPQNLWASAFNTWKDEVRRSSIAPSPQWRESGRMGDVPRSGLMRLINERSTSRKNRMARV